MADTWPHLIDATRMECRVSRDRSNYLLTFHSAQNPSVDIRFPIDFGPTLLEQIENMVRIGATAPNRTQNKDPKAN